MVSCADYWSSACSTLIMFKGWLTFPLSFPFYDWFDWLITELFDKHRYLLKTARKIHSDRPVSPTGNLIAVNLILRIFFSVSSRLIIRLRRQCQHLSITIFTFDWDGGVSFVLLLKKIDYSLKPEINDTEIQNKLNSCFDFFLLSIFCRN